MRSSGLLLDRLNAGAVSDHGSVGRRSFERPLPHSAQRHAVTILKNLCGFQVDQNYLMGNPWSAVGVP